MPLAFYLENAKSDGLEEVTLVKAVRDTETKDMVWCTHHAEVTERDMCKKAECESYSPNKSGRGVCEHRGKLYLHGESVTFNVETGKQV